MLKCIDCGYEQASGKFCGNCGLKFEETGVLHGSRSTSRLAASTQAEPNVQIEKLKMQAKLYTSYFLQQLKKPVLAFERDKTEFVNGLISFFLLGVFMALSLFTSMNQVVPSLSSFFSGALIFLLLAMGIALLTLFLITTFLGPQQSIKTIVSLYGAHLPPLVVGAIASLLLILLKSFTYGNLLLSLVFLFAVFLLPLYLISVTITKHPSAIDPLYAFIFYILSFSILFGIFLILLADSALSGYVSELLYWFN